MSLINEALKRAEAERNRDAASSHETPVLEPSPIDRRSGGKVFVVRAMMALVIAAAGWFGWGAYRDHFAMPTPAAAVADVARQTPSAVEESGDEASIVMAKTIKSVKYYQPVTDSPTENATAAEELEDTKINEHPSRPTDSYPWASFRAASESGNEVHPSPNRIEKPPTIAAPARKVDPNQYKLSGIFHGPEGATAIISGQFVRVGQTVNGAKVVRMGQVDVELEIDGQRFTIHM